jgi:hypothetical protein
MQAELTSQQINDLAKPLKGILEKFYEDPKNEEEFQKWLLNVERQKESANVC